ncbi:MAG: hypothetical protein HY900_15710 [Deltaproteobacteria bacterium]|nr:hypothetical protein [Deltaproteobacteria bacterium]
MFLTAIGLALLLIATYTHIQGYRLARLHTPMARAASEIKAQGTLSHLWLEEVLSGDPHQRVSDVWAPLARVDQEITFLREDARRSGSSILDVGGRPAREKLRTLRARLAEVREVTSARLAHPEASGPGSEIESRYDEVFSGFLDAAQDFEASVHESIRRDLASFRRAQLLLVTGGLLVLALGVLVFQRFERERVRHVREIEAAKGELERRVEQRTRALRTVNRSLAEAKEAAELANRVKDEFLERMSHELMTPLNVVLGYTDLLLDQVEGTLSDEQQKSLQKVRRHGGRLQRCLDEILELSSMVSNPSTAATSAFSPAAAVQGAVGALAAAAGRASVSLSVGIAPEVPARVRGDPERFAKAASLLLEDALCGAQGGRIAVSLISPESRAADSNPGVPLLLSVRRTGMPVSGPASTGARPEACCSSPGAGADEIASLRLTVARHLVKSLAGELWVESEPGESSVHFLVRLVEADAAPEGERPT